jgi:hypothetical protein
MALLRVGDGADGLQIWRGDANVLNKQSRTAEGGWSSSLEVRRGLTTRHRKNSNLLRNTTQSLGPVWILWQRDPNTEKQMSFGTRNVRNFYRIGSLKTVARELGKYKLDLVGLQEVRWEKGGTDRAEDCTFLYGQGNGDHQLGTGFFVHKRIVST